jgi:hypothetical protein
VPLIVRPSSVSNSTAMPTENRASWVRLLSNGFSRKLENHEAAVALNYFAYNFVRISPDAENVASNGGWRHDEAVGSFRSRGAP